MPRVIKSNYTWVADPNLLMGGVLLTNFSKRLLEWTDPLTGKPAKARALAILSGVPESRISEYRMGKRPITPEHLILFAKTMGISPEDMIGVYPRDGDNDYLRRSDTA